MKEDIDKYTPAIFGVALILWACFELYYDAAISLSLRGDGSTWLRQENEAAFLIAVMDKFIFGIVGLVYSFYKKK